MNISFVTTGDFKGHATLKRATGMAGPLMEMGHEVDILMQDSLENRKKCRLECPDVRVRWFRSGLNALAERKLKSSNLACAPCDLTWICGLGVRNWVRRPARRCIMLADHSELYSEVQSNPMRKFSYRLAEILSCYIYDGHVCASKYLENFYKTRLSQLNLSRPVHYSPYGFNSKVIKVLGKGVAPLNRRFEGRKVILYLGSLRSNYGFWDMLEAYKKLSRKRSDFQAVIIGRGPELESGLTWIRENNMADFVSITGYVEEERLPEYLSEAQVFMSPLYDTVQDKARCPSKIYMYLPYNRPVVTCGIGEAWEIFGQQGYYYQPNDISSMTDCINRALDSDNYTLPFNPMEHDYYSRSKEFVTWLSAFKLNGG